MNIYSTIEMPTQKELNLKARRELLGLSLRDVEDETGIGRSTLHIMEANTVDSTYNKVIALHNYYHSKEQ